MSLSQIFTKFLEMFFKKSSPEAQKKQLLKKLENETKTMNPVLLKNGNLQPNFAEAVYTLYKYTRILDDLFNATVGADDIQRKNRFEAQLVITGFSPSEQDLLESLSYENRKAAVLAEGGDSKSENKVYEKQRQEQEKLLKAMNTDEFKNMDAEILQLRSLVDFCKINFLPVLQSFDSNFIPGDFFYQPTYTEVPISKLENMLEDFYYQVYGLRITKATANAVVALGQLLSGGNLSTEKAEQYMVALKRIAFVITKILTTENLKILIKYVKGDENFEPKYATISGSPRQDFATLIKDKFSVDEKRIRAELQDDQIEQELTSLFSGSELLSIEAYSNEQNEILMASTNLSFKYILPTRILKTFLNVYFPESIKSLLNDLVIEGFFSNATYKKNFSDTVYACLEAENSMKHFEDAFGSDQPNSIAILNSYIKDSHNDKDFYKKLELMVSKINEDAKNLIQSCTSNLYTLYKMLGELLADAKRTTGEIIENAKVTMLSSRNKDSTNFLEQSYGTWKFFFDIMRNYVIITTQQNNNSKQ